MKRWLFTSARSVSALFLVFALLASAMPATMAENTSPGDPPLVELYLDEGSLTTQPPTGEDTQRASILGPAATPGVSYWETWGGINLEGPLTFATDTAATFWIEPDQPTVFTQMRIELMQGEDPIATGTTNQIVDLDGGNVIDSPLRLQLGLPTRGITVDGPLSVRFIFWGAGASDALDVQVLYGSQAHPSRLSFGATPDSLAALPAPEPAPGHTISLYLDDESLTVTPPTEAESRSRATESTGNGGTGAETIALAGDWSWGSWTADRDLELASDTTLTFWVTAEDPALMRTLRPVLFFGGSEVTQTAGTNTWEFVTTDTYRISIAFNTATMEIAEGTTIELGFITWSTSDPNLNEIEFLYGSTEHPSAMTLRAHGDPPGADPGLPELNMTSEHTEADVTPGGSTNFTVQLENLGETNATVDFNAITSDALTVSYPEADHMNVAGNTMNETRITVHVSPDALINTTHTFEFTAEVEGIPVANLTFTINVIRADDPEESDEDEREEVLDDEEGFLPAPGIVPILLLAFVVLKVLRRKRSE